MIRFVGSQFEAQSAMKARVHLQALRNTWSTAGRLGGAACAAFLAFMTLAEDTPNERPAPEAFAGLIQKLDHENFAVRHEAEAALLAGGQAALDNVRKTAQEKDLSPEMHEHLDRIAARLEALLAWKRIANPQRADLATGKVNVEEALLALQRVYGVSLSKYSDSSSPIVDVTLTDATWASALAEIARQANAIARPGGMDWPDRLRLVPLRNFVRNPCGLTTFAADKGALLQGVCEVSTVYNASAEEPTKLTEAKYHRVSIEAFTLDFFTQNFNRSAKNLLVVNATGLRQSIAESDYSYFAHENRIELKKELLRSLEGNPFDIEGTIVWDWPLELHRHVFVPIAQPEEVALTGNRRVSVAFEKTGDMFQIVLKERIGSPEKSRAMTKGWFIPRGKDGRRIQLTNLKSCCCSGTDDTGHFSESEEIWTMDERPANIHYEYPIDFEKRELSFRLSGLTLPKPKEHAAP